MKKDKIKEKDRTVLRLIRDAKPIAWSLALGAVLSIFSVLCTAAEPGILGGLVQQLYDHRGGGLVEKLLPGLELLLAAYAGKNLFSSLNMLLMNNVVSTHYSCGLRIQISDKIKRLPVRYVDQTPVGDVLSRMMGDISTMGGYVHQIFDIMIQGFFQLLIISVAMFREDWRMASFVVLMMPLSIFLSARIASKTDSYFHAMFGEVGKMTELVEESFSNYPTTKAYNLEEYTAEKHGEVNERLRKATEKANFIGSIVQPIIRFTNSFAYILISLIGTGLIVRRGVDVGVVVTVILYARLFASPLEQIAYGLGELNHVKAAGRRVYKLLDMEEEENPAETSAGAPEGRVQFQNVDFSYDPEQKLIKNLSMAVEPGQKVAIVGPTGAGKTTVVNLLMRFYDPVRGTIVLDGKDIQTLSREQVRGCFGMVLQDTWLFRGTIAENVAYGKPGASREEVEQACRRAYCDHFIRTMPDGYDTIIGDDTTNLSGGQKQLLTIARALLANRPLLILDEATSNVDTRTEALIQKAMDRLMKGKTCFVIAHRLSTIVDSDLILVLDHGTIVEQGTHRALLEKRGFYYRLYQSQYAV